MNTFDTELHKLQGTTVVVSEAGRLSFDEGMLICKEGTHIKFQVEALESYCLSDWNPTLYDALLLAAAIEFCDRIKKRPALGWGREFHLKVPVHSVKIWNQPEVMTALHSAINFLTGDRWFITFYSRKNPAEQNRQSKLLLHESNVTVMPFSEGLDSWAVSEIEGRRLGAKLVKVRLGRRNIDVPRKMRRGLEERKPFTSIPYKVKLEKGVHAESTNRSRGFRFALLSAVAGFLTKADRIIVSESGQGALGPWYVNLGHAYPDVRSHPLFLRKMETFLHALLGYKARYIYPRLWHTKAQTVLEAISGNHEENGWADSWSCWQQNRQVSVSGRKRQCGICAACQLRRLSLHAAGLAEKKGAYVWDNLKGSDFESAADPAYPAAKRKSITQREYAIAGSLHMEHMAGLAGANSPVYEARTLQLANTMSIPIVDAKRGVAALWARHQQEWKSFVDSLGPESFILDWIEGV